MTKNGHCELLGLMIYLKRYSEDTGERQTKQETKIKFSNAHTVSSVKIFGSVCHSNQDVPLKHKITAHSSGRISTVPERTKKSSSFIQLEFI